MKENTSKNNVRKAHLLLGAYWGYKVHLLRKKKGKLNLRKKTPERARIPVKKSVRKEKLPPRL